MEKISVIIPVYKESGRLEALLDKLTKEEYAKKEIIVIIDEPTKKSSDLCKKFGSQVKFVINKKRKGKVEALNEGIKISKGDILVFLDADVSIKIDNFLSTIAKEIRGYDILDFKKKIIQEGFISKMVNYEYLGANVVWFIFSEIIKKPTVFMNGAGFAVTREAIERLKGFRKVVAEDGDIAIRAFENNMKYKFSRKIEIETEAPRNWKSWFKQRKRWSVGAGEYLLLYGKIIIKSFLRYPILHTISFIFMFPLLIPLLFSLVFKNFLFTKLVVSLLFVLSLKLPIVIPVLSTLTLSHVMLTALSFALELLVFYTITMFIFSKLIGYRFLFGEYILFFFVYSPFSMFIWITGIVVYLIRRKTDIDWVV
jgi:cellulose synthase/poly-beta-1,6-N-acetylglucosamine synthase-like glycosyltransferase